MVDSCYYVEGIAFNSHTREKARALTLTEAAAHVGVIKRTINRWKKHPLFPRILHTTVYGDVVMDDMIDDFVKNVIHEKYQKRTWNNALKKLKNLQLIDHRVLGEKLTALLNKEWTPLQKRVNGYKKTHIEAYRRGVQDALHALSAVGYECWDYTPKLGQIVSTGACAGTVVEITDEYITVAGTYHYCGFMEDGSDGHAESWRFKYNLSDILAHDVKPRRMLHPTSKAPDGVCWHFDDVPHQ